MKTSLFRKPVFIFTIVFFQVVFASAIGRPNVVIILTDDQGYGDLSCHGNPVIETPNLDQLYRESVRLTDFHVDPTCAPTRAALITGKYSHHVGVWQTVCGGNHLRATEKTMADLFKTAGYRTGLFGKWHLGSNYPYRPIDRGFDEWLGQGDGGTGTTDDWFFNDRVDDHYWHNGIRKQIDGFAPDVFFEAAKTFITQSCEAGEPFLAYIATYLPHDPHTIPDPAIIDRYKGKISDYVAHFFAGIDGLDSNVGKLRQLLKEIGVAENTIFVFMTDNGGTAGVKLFNAGMRGRKAQVYEGGHRVPCFIHWPEGDLAVGKDVDVATAHIDILPTLLELCNIQSHGHQFDGSNLSKLLTHPDRKFRDRILFVENQRTYFAKPWVKSVGIWDKWRLVDGHELYDLSVDPGQTTNVVDQHPDVADTIRAAYMDYWNLVTENDRIPPRFIVGTEQDEEIFLTSSDWYLPQEPAWNHSQIAKGERLTPGHWNINVAQKGRYQIEFRRWPREADTRMRGVPSFSNKPIDAFLSSGAVDRLIYGSECIALPAQHLKLKVGEYDLVKTILHDDKSVIVELELEKGDHELSGELLDDELETLVGIPYVYLSLLKGS